MSKIKEAAMEAENVAALIGHNSQAMTPFEESELEIGDLYDEAKNWLDGDPIETQAQADMVQKLLRDIQAAEKRADERRIEEVRPHKEATDEIQARYNPLIGKTTKITGRTKLASEVCKKALKPFLDAEEDRKRAIAEAARIEAEEKRKVAQEAVRAAQADDLSARESAEALLRDAKASEAAAKRADNDRAKASGTGRVATLRSYYDAEVTDMTAFARWAWKERRDEVDDFFRVLAKRLIASGNRSIPGVEAREVRSVV